MERRTNKLTEEDDFQNLFGFNENQSQKQDNRIVELPIKKLVEYEDTDFLRSYNQPQPFREYTEDELNALAQSIKDVGIIEPVVVRPQQDKYQILTGRHRKRASVLIGEKSVPCRIINADDDTAALIMITTNLNQRHNLLPSEKAFAYRIQLEITNRQGQRTDLETLCNDCTKIDSLHEAGKKNKDSRRTVAYYIRLTYLLPELLKMVDIEKLPMMSGVNLSYLTKDNQQIVLNWLNDNCFKLNVKQAEQIIETANESILSDESLCKLFLTPSKPIQIQTFKVQRKKWKDYDDLLPNDSVDFDNLFRQFLDWLRIKNNEAC